jgi:NAD(P)-dependent dehydrogenase (short-subunit alcohol dehydrogenase family)
MHDSALEPAALRGRVAIVTGGTVGLGRAVARELSREGAQVAVVGRDAERLERCLAEIADGASGSTPLAIVADVTRAADMQAMAERTLERFGRIDILVASAGILRARGAGLKTLAQISAAEWDEVLETNLTGVFLANRAVLPAMLRQGSGHVINVSSTSGRKGYAFDAAYCASKFGILGLTQALAAEVRARGVKVEALLPGALDTGMWDQNGPLVRPDYAIPVERAVDAVLYLLRLPRDASVPELAVEPLGRVERTGFGAAGGRA